MSRELDAEIAEKVMQLSLMRWTNHPEHEPVLIQDGAKIPQYSTNISDAWLVVEKMRERGWECRMEYRHFNEFWDVFFWREYCDKERDESLDDFGQSQLEELPEAICRAALEAVKCNGAP